MYTFTMICKTCLAQVMNEDVGEGLVDWAGRAVPARVVVPFDDLRLNNYNVEHLKAIDAHLMKMTAAAAGWEVAETGRRHVPRVDGGKIISAPGQ